MAGGVAVNVTIKWAEERAKPVRRDVTVRSADAACRRSVRSQC